MTLDEAIKDSETISEESQRVVDTGIVFDDVTIDELYCDDTEVIEEQLAKYQKTAENYRQLAELLKELKQLREQTRWIPVSENKKLTNGEYIEKIVEQDEDYCILKDYVEGTVTIEVSLEWWNKSQAEREDQE